MKRVTVTVYINEYFEPGSRPTHSTVIRWVNKKQLAGEKIGGTWYIYPDKTIEPIEDDGEKFKMLCTKFRRQGKL